MLTAVAIDDGEQLSEQDFIPAAGFIQSVMNLFQIAHYQMTIGRTFGSELRKAIGSRFLRFVQISAPGVFREYWAHRKTEYSPRFIQYVEDLIPDDRADEPKRPLSAPWAGCSERALRRLCSSPLIREGGDHEGVSAFRCGRLVGRLWAIRD